MKFRIFEVSSLTLLRRALQSKITQKTKYPDTKSLMDRPGVTPALFDHISDLLRANKQNPSAAIEIVENEILANTDSSLIDESISYVPIDFDPKRQINSKLPESNFDEAEDMKTIYKNLNEAWRFLTKFSPNLSENNSTLIHFNIPYFVPGGRFKEFYYWDSFWTLKGLLKMEMENSALHLIRNFIQLIKKYGFVPNGSRLYYLGRTQPPFFTQMIYLLYNYNKSKYESFVLGEALDAVIIEYNWLIKNRTVSFQKDGETYELSRYFEESDLPRFESFREDYKVALDLQKSSDQVDENQIKKLFTDLRTAAESGWDFSSRWLKDGINLHTIHTSDFIPADLNAIMYRNEKIISELLGIKGDLELSRKFKERMNRREKAIEAVLWNPTQGVWNDYDFINGEFNDKNFYFSNIMPMLMGINLSEMTVKNILNKYKKELFGYIGGVPASGKPDKPSQQQWDFPNVWAPNQSMLVDFLADRGLIELAIHSSRSFYENVKIGFKNYGVFFEKYNCESIGNTGKGGEYLPQEGFGWTNGVTIDFIHRFGKYFTEKFDHPESYKLVCKILDSTDLKVEIPELISNPTIIAVSSK